MESDQLKIAATKLVDALSWEPQYCCSGLPNECYCLGKPTNPPPSAEDPEIISLVAEVRKALSADKTSSGAE